GNCWSVPRTQEWITELHRKFITTSSFSRGHTRTSREVIPGLPSSGGPISPTMCGFAGLAMSSISTPGCGCGQLLPGPRGSPTPQADEPSVRFPIYMKCRKMVAAAFIPRPNSGSCPTTTKFFDVPGVPPPGPTVTPSGCALPPPRALAAPAAGIASRLTEAAMHTSAGRNLMIITSPGPGLQSPHTVDPHNPTGKGRNSRVGRPDAGQWVASQVAVVDVGLYWLRDWAKRIGL